MNKSILIIGACGQIGTELTLKLREMEFTRDHVEAALAHKISGVEGIYNKAIYLEPRRSMMQEWADHLDELVLRVSKHKAA